MVMHEAQGAPHPPAFVFVPDVAGAVNVFFWHSVTDRHSSEGAP